VECFSGRLGLRATLARTRALHEVGLTSERWVLAGRLAVGAGTRIALFFLSQGLFWCGCVWQFVYWARAAIWDQPALMDARFGRTWQGKSWCRCYPYRRMATQREKAEGGQRLAVCMCDAYTNHLPARHGETWIGEDASHMHRELRTVW
jgi:hypothetical protein